MSGWYIMHRGWMDGFKPEPFSEREAFLWSIEQAAWEAHDQWFNGQQFAVQRGEFVTSLRVMADAFGWTVKRVRGLMDRLGKAGKWAQRPAHDGAQAPTILSVLNYAKYQELPRSEGTVPGTAKGTQRAQRGHSGGTQQNRRKPQETPLLSPSDSSASGCREHSGSQAVGIIAGASALAVNADADPVTRAFEGFDAVRRECMGGTRRLEFDADRRRKLASRLAEIGGPAAWGEVLATIRGSPFLRGEKTGRPVATIDWLLNPTNLRKVREGNYTDERSSGYARGPATSSPVSAMRAARAAVGLERPGLRQ